MSDPKRERKPKDAAAVEKPMRSGPRGGALKTGPTEKPAPKTIPNAPKKGRPGHNGGGWLKTGNVVGVGRKPAEVRGEILSTVAEATAVMRSILDGEFKVEIRDMFGKIVGYRTATIKEVAIVYKALADHALPTRQEMSGPNGGPIPIENATPNIDAFLDRLSDEDLATMREISARAYADPDPE